MFSFRGSTLKFYLLWWPSARFSGCRGDFGADQLCLQPQTSSGWHTRYGYTVSRPSAVGIWGAGGRWKVSGLLLWSSDSPRLHLSPSLASTMNSSIYARFRSGYLAQPQQIHYVYLTFLLHFAFLQGVGTRPRLMKCRWFAQNWWHWLVSTRSTNLAYTPYSGCARWRHSAGVPMLASPGAQPWIPASLQQHSTARSKARQFTGKPHFSRHYLQNMSVLMQQIFWI